MHPQNTTQQTKAVRMGIIGSNFVVEWFLNACKLEPQRIVPTAMYSRNLERAQQFSTKYNIPHTFTSLKQMSESPLIDGVYIASPNSLHFQQSILFLSNKKHVLCEKPFASTLRQAKQMVKCAIENKVSLMQAMKSTLSPNFRVVRELLPKIGKIRTFYSQYCQHSSRYQKYKDNPLSKEVSNTWSLQFSSGALMDIGVYAIYPLIALFKTPKTIKAQGVLLQTGVDILGCASFLYQDGMVGTVQYSKVSDSLNETEIQGEEGTIKISKIQTMLKVTLKLRHQNQVRQFNQHHEPTQFIYQIREFVDLINTSRLQSQVNSFENSLRCMQVMDEIRRQVGVVYQADLC